MNLPNIQLKVRNEFLYNHQKGHGEYTNGWLVCYRAIKGKALTFVVLLENGALFTGLPVNALCFREIEKLPLGVAQMWDCLSYESTVIQMDLIKGMSCEVLLKNKQKVTGTYLFTIDFNSKNSLPNLSETPNEFKYFHFIKLDNGNLIIYPQNRIVFKDASLINNIDPLTLQYKINETDYTCEDGEKWTAHTDQYFYSIITSD